MELDLDIRGLMNRGMKIPAIKLLRERYSLSLRDAKDLVDSRDYWTLTKLCDEREDLRHRLDMVEDRIKRLEVMKEWRPE